MLKVARPVTGHSDTREALMTPLVDWRNATAKDTSCKLETGHSVLETGSRTQSLREEFTMPLLLGRTVLEHLRMAMPRVVGCSLALRDVKLSWGVVSGLLSLKRVGLRRAQLLPETVCQGTTPSGAPLARAAVRHLVLGTCRAVGLEINRLVTPCRMQPHALETRKTVWRIPLPLEAVLLGIAMEAIIGAVRGIIRSEAVEQAIVMEQR